MSKQSHEYHHEPNDSVPDISQLATARLKPHRPGDETRAQQIAQHEVEIQRLRELSAVLEQAITALVFRLYIMPDHRLHEALEHNRADLQRFKDELASLQTEHQHTIERLQKQRR
ncbi:MAG: hypothetical protein ACLQUY_03580 [Ktedonobacterales bacterium]